MTASVVVFCRDCVELSKREALGFYSSYSPGMLGPICYSCGRQTTRQVNAGDGPTVAMRFDGPLADGAVATILDSPEHQGELYRDHLQAVALRELRRMVGGAVVGCTLDATGWPTFRFSVMRNREHLRISRALLALVRDWGTCSRPLCDDGGAS